MAPFAPPCDPLAGTKWLHQTPFRWTAPPRPGHRAGCEDKHLNCPAWAASKECLNNPGFMVGDPGADNGQCMLSCKVRAAAYSYYKL
eukprot:1187326-Prorocentrum_minimum.AAC.1